MINVNTIFETVCRLINKTAQVAYSDFNKFLPMAERQLFDELAPPMGTATYEVNGKLAPFIKTEALTVSETGQVQKPTKFNRWLSARSEYVSTSASCSEEVETGTAEVKVVEHHRLGQALSSRLFKPTEKYPIAVTYDAYFQVYPKSLTEVQLDYLVLPEPAKWGFTLSNGRPVYDAASSVNSQFGEDCANELIVRVLASFGVNMKAQDLTQYGEVKQKQVV